MYSRSLASFFFIAAAFFLAALLPTASALPAEPDRTVGDVVAENHDLACNMRGCLFVNETDNHDAVNATENSTDEPATNGASPLHQFGVLLPAVVVGSSLLLLV